MGKVTGFMEEGRSTPQKRPAEERVKDYLEIYEDPSQDFIKTQASQNAYIALS